MEECLVHLRTVGPVQDYVICAERHKDGNSHLHAWCRYTCRVTLSARTFDLNGHHGNYQVAKSPAAVIAYVTKGGEYITSMNLKAKESRKAARNEQLLVTPIHTLVEQGEISVFQAKGLQQARQVIAQAKPAYEHDAVRGIWIIGPPGVGKSHHVRHAHPDEGLYIKSQNKWWDLYAGEPTVLLDDFDMQGQCLGHHLKLWADKWACDGEVKGGTVHLHHKRFYVTSNYSIDEIWPGEQNHVLRQALLRRFVVHRITKRGDPFN